MFSNLLCTLRFNLRIAAFRSQNIKSMESQFHTNITRYAVKKTTSAAGGVLGLGRGKKKLGKVGTMEKKQLPVETDPEKLVSYVCGSNIYITGEDVKIKDDSEYPEWLWTLNTGAAPRIEDLDPNTKQYWKRVRAAGPGPGAYRLPTTVGFPQHDPSRNRSPMYSFGTAAGARLRALGPGPAYRIDRVTRDGVVSAPAWSFGSRLAGRGAQRVPGPGAHAPERCPPTREPRAPQYSMGARLGFALKRPGPAANAYALRLGPGGPAYTMGARVGFNPKARSPGPAVYYQRDADVYRARAPHYSLAARSDGAGKGTRTPGPAAYPPNLYNTKKNPYAYSFGTKHGDYAPPMIIKEDTMDCL